MWIRKLSTVLVLCAALVSPSFAGKGHGGGGNGGGGGDPPPSQPDPAIVYADSQSGGLFVMDADGANRTEVVTSSFISGAWFNTDPSWSADGSRVVFRRSATQSLYTVKADGTDLTEVFADHAFFPIWSPTATPDGSEKIAFRHGNDIWLVNPDGTEARNLTNTPNRVETYPTWAPDGKRIAVFCQDLGTDGNGNTIITGRSLTVLHLAAGATDPVNVDYEEVIVAGGADLPVFSFMDWARTEDKVLFSRLLPDDSRDLYVIDLVSGAETQLTSNSNIDEFRASWSPDDSQIIFESIGSKKFAKNTGLYVMNADGSGTTSLGVANGRIPNWRR